MAVVVSGVRQGDVLKLDAPEEIPEGIRVELQLVRTFPEGAEEERDIEAFVTAIHALQEEAARDPEWWDEFDRDRRRYPVTFPDRNLSGEEK